MQLEVRALIVTWSGGVTFGVIASSFFGNVPNCWLKRFDKFENVFFSLSAKNLSGGGGGGLPPPAVCGLKQPVTLILVNPYFCSKLVEHDVTLTQGWICRLPGARENITVCGVAPVPSSTHRFS